MKKETSPHWQSMIGHINQTWKAKKGFGYPFRGREFKDLKTMTNNFKEWQLMALWDVFMGNNSEWVTESGYSINAFLSCLCWLIDDKDWKYRAQKYEERLCPKLDQDIDMVLKDVMGNQKNHLADVRKQELRREGLTS